MNNKVKANPLGLVSLLGISMLYVPLSQMLLSFSSPYAYFFLPISVVLMCTVGYVFQHIYSRIIGKRASTNAYGTLREGLFDQFRIQYAIIPILGCIVFSLIVAKIYDIYLLSLLEQNIIRYYDLFYPVMTFVLALLTTVSGAVIWFYPPERLSNIYVLIVGCALFLIESFFYFSISGTLNGGVVVINFNLGIPLTVFTVCTLIIYNQSNLVKEYKGSVVSVIKSSEKRYNLFLVLIFGLAFLASALLLYVVLSGLSIIVRAIVFLVLYKTFYGHEDGVNSEKYEYVDPDYAKDAFNKGIMTADNETILYVFFTIVILAVVGFILLKTGNLKKMIESIKAWFREFLDTLSIGSDIFRHSFDPNEEEGEYNYKDEKKNLQDALIRDYVVMAESTSSYKQFMQKLSRLDDYDAQLCFAYAMLLKAYKSDNVSLRHSDTPREAEKKIILTLDEQEISDITKSFEAVRYAEEDISTEEAARVLDKICASVKRHMF